MHKMKTKGEPPSAPPMTTGEPIQYPTIEPEHVPLQQPQERPTLITKEFNSGLCDCFNDCRIFFLTCFCPCYTFADNMSVIEDDEKSFCPFLTLYIIFNCLCGLESLLFSTFGRWRLRDKYGLTKTTCKDCLVHWFCHKCALCQEARFIKAVRENTEFAQEQSGQAYQAPVPQPPPSHAHVPPKH